MLRPLFVIGTGGLAREMAQLASQVDPAGSRWDFRGFIAASSEEVGRDLGWGPVAGEDAWLLGRDGPADLIIGIGRPSVRALALTPYLSESDRFTFPNVIHPTAHLDADWVSLGRGNTITAGCLLTTDIGLGDFNLLNLHTTVGHDARLGDGNVINPSASISGGVSIGDRVLVGTGARILEGLSIGSDATVGAGAVVTRDVAPSVTVVGVPARPFGSPSGG